MKLSKSELIVILFSMLIATISANAQDTVYIGTIANNATITYKGTVKSIPLSLISASKFTGVLQPTRVAIYNGATQVDDWVFNNYPFKVNDVFVTNVDSFVPYVNRLNTASIRSMKMIQEYLIVSALPATIDPNITYLVGARDTIAITGLNGNSDGYYSIVADIVNPKSSDAVIMRFNNISTNVYDYRYSYAGSTSTTSAVATNSFVVSPTSGTNSLNNITIAINASAGINRTYSGTILQGSAGQNTVAGMLLTGGTWRDSSTNLTSITFRYPSITGGYGVGTRIRVYALRP